jgi:membrane fusion protein (multidrug efflux system)
MQRDVAITRDYVGQIRSNRHIEMRAIERGYLQQVAVNEGQWVEQGQLMFKLLPLTYQAELQRAEAEARAAQLEYENTRSLADNNVVAATELALAQTRYEKAQAEVDLAAAHLAFTEVRAPFSGIMDRLQVREGSLVEEGEFLTTLSDNSVVWVYYNVPEAEYLDYMAAAKTGAAEVVELQLANGRMFGHPGVVAVIEADFNNQTGTIPFRADFPNPERLLRHGQTGNVLMRSPIPDAVVVPQKATFEVLDQYYVYRVDADGHVTQQRIRVREELEDLFVVEDGITAADRIVLEGLRQVRDGDEIEFEYREPEAVFAALKMPAE